MKLYLCSFLGLIILFLSGCAQQPAVSRQNLSYEYKAATAIKHDLRTENDSLHLYLQFADKGFFAFPKNIVVSYTVSLEYEKAEITMKDSVRAPFKHILTTDKAVYLDFKISRRNLRFPSVLVVKVYSKLNLENSIWHDIRLIPAEINKTYFLADAKTSLPLFRNFVLVNQPFFIAQYESSAPGELKRYEANFSLALPPMAKPDNTAAATLKKLSIKSFLADTIKLADKGLYSIEIGGKPMGGLLVEENAFPELTSAAELIQPLIYLTTTKEREKLYNAKDPKAAVDQFWLDVVPDQKQARELIRVYYLRVMEANKYFTAHKAGWQTDRGMIYLIFGPPQQVNRFFDREEWAYPADAYRSGVKFVFLKKPNTFTQNHYELVRSPALEGFWYRTVDQWRTGTIEK